jgi:hypothetical protein
MKKLFNCRITFFLLLSPCVAMAQYKGSASVSQGIAATITPNLYNCTGGRIAGIGTIKASDSSVWTVPAAVNFTNSSFPFSSDLNNVCNGNNYGNVSAALAALNGSDIVTIDADGELITAYVFADNYFEMYINGTPVGKDKVPFTQFNSSIVRFKVKRPFTIAMHLIDWEENLGLGSELNGGFAYHPGDGGMVAVFKDASNNIIAKTGSDWKAQTFYTAPITDLSCPIESGSSRLSTNCSTANSNDGSKYYALHWNKPVNWQADTFNDTEWPNAITYSNATVGIDNKTAYTNFTNIFDDVNNDAQFIWSSNLILDNEVVVRKTVAAASKTEESNKFNYNIQIYPNPANTDVYIDLLNNLNAKTIQNICLYNLLGEKVFESNSYISKIPLSNFSKGVYLLKINMDEMSFIKKIIIE